MIGVILSLVSNHSAYCDTWVQWENKCTHRSFLHLLAPPDFTPNPLPILMRAVNAVRARFSIRQPCWRRGRWKSLT